MVAMAPDQIILDDHRRIRGLFARLEPASEARPALLELMSELQVHSKLMAEVVYPQLVPLSGMSASIADDLIGNLQIEATLNHLHSEIATQSPIAGTLGNLWQHTDAMIVREETTIVPRLPEVGGLEALGEQMASTRRRLLVHADARNSGL